MWKHNVFIFGMVVLSLIFCVCGQSPTDYDENGITSFPLHTADRWEYSQIDYQIPFGGQDSEVTVTTRFIRRVIGVDTSINTIGLIIVDDSLIYTFPGHDDYTSIERHWWRVMDHDVYEIASGYGTEGDRFRPVFWEQPRLLLDFPLSSGKNWILGQSEFGTLSMKVIDFQSFALGEQSFYCALVKTSLEYYPHIGFTDWYSNSGLIYSHAEYGLSYMQDELGNIIDSVYVYRDITLDNINLTD